MKSSFNTILFCCIAFILNAPSWGAEKGTPDQAIAMVGKAATLLKASGQEKAFAEFQNPSGSFRDRDLYIFVLSMAGDNLANGANPRLIGKNTWDLKDADGKQFVREMIDTATKKGGGWVDYKWPNPAEKTIQHKSAYIEKVGELIVGCGIYKP